jgi:hypothetical protein
MRGQRGDSFWPGSGVALEGTEVAVAALGHEERKGDVLLGELREGA